MKKILSIIVCLTMLTSCDVKKEAVGLYYRITDFFSSSEPLNTEISSNEESKKSGESNISIDVNTNNDDSVNVNISDNENQILDANIDQETYDKYDDLINKAQSYASENNIDVERLQTDKAYMMKHALSFSSQYDVDLSSLSAEDMDELQRIFTK